MQSIRKRLAFGSLIYGLGGFLHKGLSLLLLPIYTLYLSPADYGILASVILMIMFLEPLLGLGITGALGRMFYETSDFEKRRTLISTLVLFFLAWSLLVVSFLHFFGAPWLDTLFKEVRFEPFLKIGLWLTFFSIVGAFPATIYQIEQRPMHYQTLSFAGFFLNVGLIFWFVVGLEAGPLGSLYGQLIANGIMALVGLYLLARRIRFVIDPLLLKSALRFGVPLVLSLLGSIVTSIASRYFVERYASLTDLGLYNLAFQYSAVGFLIFNGVFSAWSPLFYETGDRPEGPSNYARFSLWIIGGASGVFLFFALLAPEVIHLVTQKEFHSATQFIPVLMASSVIASACWSLSISPMLLRKRVSSTVILTFIGGITCVALNLWWTPLYGAMGAACANLSAVLVQNFSGHLWSRKIYPVPFYYKKMASLIFLAAALFAGIQLLPSMNLWFLIFIKLISIALFTFALFPLGVISKNDWQRLSGWFLRVVLRRESRI